MKSGGFTLIEMLVVLAIVGILLAIGTPNVLRALQQQKVSAATQEVTSSVNDVRSRVRRNNVCYRMTFGNTSSFTVTEFGTRDCSGSAVRTSTVALPGGTALKSMNSTAATGFTTKSVDFITPYGQNRSGLPLDLAFGIPGKEDLNRNLRISGVLGTVILK